MHILEHTIILKILLFQCSQGIVILCKSFLLYGLLMQEKKHHSPFGVLVVIYINPVAVQTK